MPNAFDNMPDVGKKKKTGALGQPNRTPLLLGVLAGCLLLFLCGILAGGGYWFWSQQGKVATATGNTSSGTSPSLPILPGSSGGRSLIAYSVETGATPEQKSVWVMGSDGSDPKQLLSQASSPVFSPDGSLIAYYHWNDGIYLANSDGTNPRKILGESNAKYLAWSNDGKWIAFASQPSLKENSPVNIDAIKVDGSGRRTIVIGGTQPAWSPDDTQIVFSTCRGSDCGIFKASSAGGDAGTKVIGELGSCPAWSPSGNKIVYQADADGVKQLFVVNADGTGKKQLTSGTVPHVGAQWSRDGATIFYRSPEGGSWGIWRMNADGTNPKKIANDVIPVEWAYERLALSR
jgi:Tol biopolymer transport system component